jgi:hypothetical protein
MAVTKEHQFPQALRRMPGAFQNEELASQNWAWELPR